MDSKKMGKSNNSLSCHLWNDAKNQNTVTNRKELLSIKLVRDLFSSPVKVRWRTMFVWQNFTKLLEKFLLHFNVNQDHFLATAEYLALVLEAIVFSENLCSCHIREKNAAFLPTLR